MDCSRLGTCNHVCTLQNEYPQPLQSMRDDAEYRAYLATLPENEAVALKIQVFRALKCVYCQEPFKETGSCVSLAGASSTRFRYETDITWGLDVLKYDRFDEVDHEGADSCSAIHERQVRAESSTVRFGMFAFAPEECQSRTSAGTSLLHSKSLYLQSVYVRSSSFWRSLFLSSLTCVLLSLLK
jgi:hypothetical protein